MKKSCAIYLLAISMVLAWGFLGLASGESEETPNPAAVATITIKNDVVINPENTITVQWLTAYTKLDALGLKGFALGTDVISSQLAHPENLQVKSYATYNLFGPFSLIAGASVGDQGSYSLAGFWYYRDFGKFTFFADVRYYHDVGGSEDYSDVFLETIVPINKSWFWGADVASNHWLFKNHDWILAGVLVGHKITNNLTVVGRGAPTWTMTDTSDHLGGEVRLEIRFDFF
ncbi:MAG TPA: hypothetical protein VK255_00940 [Patescibacteria group bacterium]|nr:hypothetical protein [Patescibacteria group bacterium]